MERPACRACGGPATSSVTAREMMFGLRDEFAYDECGSCGCVQLREAPAEMGRFYPGHYYSLANPQRRSRLAAAARQARDVVMYRNPAGLGTLMARILPKLPADRVEWFRHTGTGRESRILDVGSGGGQLVQDLGAAGFTTVLGIDPFVEDPRQFRSGVRVERATIQETSGEFDLIMFHHSLEHMTDQVGTLRRAVELLAPGGWCLVRIPVAASYAWRHYRENWVQLDAPRHHVLHSVASLGLVAAAAGLEVDRVVHDSTGLQFLGSEAYRRDIPLIEATSAFSAAERRHFERRARALNAAGDGDQACFYLRRSREAS